LVGTVRWIGAGAADKLGTLALTIGRDDVESTFALTSERAQAEGLRQIEVSETTLNEIVRTSDAPFPDMVKIDAEGHGVLWLCEVAFLRNTPGWS
jgi:hypothetical protein